MAKTADSHDLIRVHGARENNLKDVDVELPKRRLTVFTGVSGSGKSSLVFDTIAAESQRLINETYSAFIQGFMPTLARPEVDVLEGLTTAIIVDQQRMGADPRSTVGTATDTGAMLRILFSRLGKPHIGSPQAFSFNVASISGAGAVTMERGGRTVKERRDFNIVGGMCPRCEGRGSINDIDLTALYDDSKSLNEGALTIPGFSMEGWYGRIFNGCGYFDMDKPIAKFTKKELDALLHKEATKLKIDGVNLTYLGLIPQPIEGGVTRFMAVFHSELPAEVGPVRSARPVDVPFGTGFGVPVFAYSGARPEVQSQLHASPMVVLEEGAPGFTRVPDRRAPHDLFVAPTEILAAGTERGAAPLPGMAFAFDVAPPDGAASCDDADAPDADAAETPPTATVARGQRTARTRAWRPPSRCRRRHGPGGPTTTPPGCTAATRTVRTPSSPATAASVRRTSWSSRPATTAAGAATPPARRTSTPRSSVRARRSSTGTGSASPPGGGRTRPPSRSSC